MPKCGRCGFEGLPKHRKRCDGCRRTQTDWKRDFPERNRASFKKYRDRLKKEVYDHYGHSCKCCGESNPFFLTLDHINNDGYKQGRRGKAIATWHREIIKAGFPTDLQTLCMQCNCGKARNKGVCPHVSNLLQLGS
jgi:hypothetical protein